MSCCARGGRLAGLSRGFWVQLSSQEFVNAPVPKKWGREQEIVQERSGVCNQVWRELQKKLHPGFAFMVLGPFDGTFATHPDVAEAATCLDLLVVCRLSQGGASTRVTALWERGMERLQRSLGNPSRVLWGGGVLQRRVQTSRCVQDSCCVPTLHGCHAAGQSCSQWVYAHCAGQCCQAGT